jgi:hypothetical protein
LTVAASGKAGDSKPAVLWVQSFESNSVVFDCTRKVAATPLSVGSASRSTVVSSSSTRTSKFSSVFMTTMEFRGATTMFVPLNEQEKSR